MDQKNFHEFKTGKYPVPRLERLEALARILRVNKHFVFEVAAGIPAKRVYQIIKTDNIAAKIRLLSRQLDKFCRAIIESEKRYRALFNNANDAILIVDTRTGKILNANKQAEHLLGRTRAEIIGMNRSKIHPPSKYKYYQKHFRNHVQNEGLSERRPSEVIRKDGTVIPVLISSSVFELEGRKVIQGIFRDIRNLKRLSLNQGN
jgi:PAS domain S-box-containing protein